MNNKLIFRYCEAIGVDYYELTRKEQRKISNTLDFAIFELCESWSSFWGAIRRSLK